MILKDYWNNEISLGSTVIILEDAPDSSFFYKNDIILVSEIDGTKMHGYLVGGPSFTGVIDTGSTNYVHNNHVKVLAHKIKPRKVVKWCMK